MIEEKRLLTYKTWAPIDSKWTAWIKPVLFASLSSLDFETKKIENLLNVEWTREIDHQTAIIVDLPGAEGILVSLALAKNNGFRPVPLYNGCSGSSPKSTLVDVTPITRLLPTGGKFLNEIDIRTDAAPVFMLDSRRMENAYPTPGKFDNRWCIFAQDMPSGKFLLKEGYNKVLVRAENIGADLSHILCRYQEEGIQIQIVKDGLRTIENITVRKPSRFKSILYRSSILFGLRRNSTGGFGGRVPEPMEHHAGVGYRGLG